MTFNEAMLASSRLFKIRISQFVEGKYQQKFDETTVRRADIDFGAYQTGELFTTGSTAAGVAKFEVSGIVEGIKKLTQYQIEIGLDVGDAWHYRKMGVWFVNDVKIDRNSSTTTFELIDGMYKLNQDYRTDLRYPAQIRDVIRECAAKTGVELASDDLGHDAISYRVESAPTGDNLTFRTVLGWASQLLGYSAFFDRYGKLAVRGLTESGITATADNYFLHGFDKSELAYQIAGITCKVKDKEVLTVGVRTGRSLEIENPLMTQSILDELYYKLKDITYYPYSLDWQGHLGLDVGQVITIITNKQETYKVPVFTQSITFAGGLRSKISADSKAGNDAQYSHGGFLTKRIIQQGNTIRAEVQQQLERADREFDAKTDKLRKEVENGIEAAKAKAEEKAAEIADVLRPEIAAAKEEVTNDLAKAKTDLTALGNSALAKASTAQQAADDTKQQLGQLSADLKEVTTHLTAETSELSRRVYLAQGYIDENKASLSQQAKDILAQAQAQTELVRRTETVEQTLDGQRTTITELGKGLDGATGQIQSVGNRTKTVEEGLSDLRTNYSQLTAVVNPLTDQVQSVESRTATLESGINGIREAFDVTRQTLGRYEEKSAEYERDANGIRERLTSVEENSVKNLSGNMLVKSAEGWRQGQIDLVLGDKLEFGKTYTVAVKADKSSYKPTFWTATKYSEYEAKELSHDHNLGAYIVTFTAPRVNEAGDSVIVTIDGTARTEYVTLVQGKLPLVPWAPHWSEIKAQLAEYTAEYKRTAQGMTERLTALEVYKNAENDRATNYFERAKEETAKQRAEVWKAVQDGYVANATYTEDVRGIRHQYNEIRTLATGAQSTANEAKNAASTADRKAVTVTQNLADYKADVDQQLTRLQQNQRDTDGRISSLDTSMSLIPGQITTAVSAVEGKIPVIGSTVNIVRDSKINESSNAYGFGFREVNLVAGKSYWFAARAKKNGGTSDKRTAVFIYKPDWSYSSYLEFSSTNYEVKFLKFVPRNSGTHWIRSYWYPREGDRSGTGDVDWYLLVESDTRPSDWSPAPEDLISAVSSMQTTVTQTADGVRQLSTKVTTAEGNITTVQADIRRLNDVISNRLSETAIDDIKQQIRSVESLYEQTTKSFTQRLTDVTAKLPKGYSGNMLVNSGKGWSNQTQMDYILAESIIKGQTYTIASRYWRQSGVTEPGAITFWLVADHTTERINQNVTMTYDREVDAWVATFTAEGNAPAGKVVILTMTRGSASWATLAKGSLAISPWTPSAKDVTDQIDAKASEIRQEIGKIDLSVQGIRGDMLHKNAVTVQDDGIVLKAGKTSSDVAKAIASYFKLTPEAVSIITPLIKVSGDMIVNGAITAAKLDVGSVATAILTAEAITSKHIKADRALVEKIISAEGYFDTLFSKSAFITKLQAVDLTATQIKGGVMRAINNAMAVNLNQGNIEFYTSNAALRRVLTGYPTQFVKFETGQYDGKPVGVTVIGSNRGGTENSNDGTFVGARFWNGNGVDIIDLVGDEIRLVNNAYSDTTGWVLDTLSGRLALEPIKDSDRPSSKLAAGDLWLYKNRTEYISVKNEIKAIWDTFGSKTDQSYANQLGDDIGTIKWVINMLIDNVNALHRYKATETGYSYSMPNKI